MDVSNLTKHDILFIDEYFVNGFNATQAYMHAFNLKQSNKKEAQRGRTKAYSFMNREVVKKEIERRWEEIRQEHIINQKELLLHAKDLLTSAVEAKDRTDIVKAIDLLNKMTGGYVQRIDASITNNITLTIPGLESQEEKDEE